MFPTKKPGTTNVYRAFHFQASKVSSVLLEAIL
jgi:hypothetical protein